MRALLLLALLLPACADDPVDTDPVVDDRPEPEGCDETEVFVDGPDVPRVGDEWTLTMKCDGATLFGPMTVRVEPTDLAFVDENTIEWVAPGTATIDVRLGSERESVEVEVLEE